MKKLIKRIGILLIIILTITLSIKMLKLKAENKEEELDIIQNWKGEEVNLSNVETVTLGGYDENITSGYNHYTALWQANVYCVQHGVDLKQEKDYSVGPKIKVKDPKLAYILNQGPDFRDKNKRINREEPHNDAQKALWYYLANNTNDDSNKILGNLNSGGGGEYNNIYKAAENYAKTNPNSKPSLKLSIDGNNLVVEVNSNYDYNLYINGKKYNNYNKDVKTIKIDASTINSDKANVKIVPLVTKYSASYRILKSAAGQRMIIVTNRSSGLQEDENIKIEKEIELNTDVSLQKYITQVNGVNLTDNQIGLKDRKNTKTYENDKTNSILKDPSKNNKATNNYKLNNVVNIEAGDTVTYRINVYNNSNVKARKVEIVDTLLYYGNGQRYNDCSVTKITRDGKDVTWTSTSDGRIKYTIENLEGNAETYFDITVKINKYLPNTVIANRAYIQSTEPKNKDTYRKVDDDYISMKTYAVSLEKYIQKVGEINYSNNRKGKAEYLTKEGNNYIDKTVQENESTFKKHNEYKYNNVVEVQNGDEVEYMITIKNDGKTNVKNIVVQDTFEQPGLEFVRASGYGCICNVNEDKSAPNQYKIRFTEELKPGNTASVVVALKVTQSNMSTNILINNAKITEMQNRNGMVVPDTTPANNEDNDYIQSNYKSDEAIISGIVWNDRALDKTATGYNGLYDSGNEDLLSGITVKLYREGISKPVATTKTNKEGYYSFSDKDIDKNVVTNSWEQYIKASKVKGTNRWDKFYAYYVVFEYDGIKYTPTPDGKTAKLVYDQNAYNDETYVRNSNASEDNMTGAADITKREEFNKRFDLINNESGIEYTTKNEEEFIPQSNYVYNDKTMSMQASTSILKMDANEEKVKEIQHVNLGLRGREVFDLELTSDVYSTKVTVNSVDGEYRYNDNKVTIRKSDLSVYEDAANIASEKLENVTQKYEQKIRKSDIGDKKLNLNGKDSGLKIEVTYKITVKNASQTNGTATKIIDYFDKSYNCMGAYANSDYSKPLEYNTLNTNNKSYKTIEITTPGTNLTQSSTMEIYLKFELNSPKETLGSLVNNGEVATYNMAEISEYTTKCANGQTEYIRGLIDKDSAPGSANKEQVRLTTTVNSNTKTKDGEPTTVQYYFGGNDLTKLKYEDDTYASPTLYFKSEENQRKISGTVFEDNTEVTKQKVKTGNGKLDNGENKINGVTVELYEANKESNNKIATTYTNENGKYLFSGFLPGTYTIKYKYGDSGKTALKTAPNKASYNGEDYQSTNNSIKVSGAAETNQLNTTRREYWYLDNESDGISVATDDAVRRGDVSKNVMNFEIEDLKKLNKVRNGDEVDENFKNKLIADTQMVAATSEMKFEIEKASKNGDKGITKNSQFGEYTIDNMNFGIAKVPVTHVNVENVMTEFTIIDSAGKNTIATAKRNNDGTWKIKGNVIQTNNLLDTSIENEKLQGAKLQATYTILQDVTVEKNFDNTERSNTVIKELVDFVNNNFSYNPDLNKYWEVTSYEDKEIFKGKDGKKSIVDPDGKKYSTIVKLNKDGKKALENNNLTITLEKVLSAQDGTISNVIQSDVDINEYNNTIEIIDLDYSTTEAQGKELRDRIRRIDPVTTSEEGAEEKLDGEYTVIPKKQFTDYKSGNTLTIHPPTGLSKTEKTTYIIAIISLISLGILAAGIFGIKKFVVKKK